MSLFFDQLFNGVAAGTIYASVALSLVIIYRTTGFLNFAQGEMALFSTCITWWIADRWGWSIWAALAASVVVSFVAGGLIERILIRPVEQARNPLNVVIVTLGMFLSINALAALIFVKPGQDTPKLALLFPKGEFATIAISKTTAGRAGVLAIECLLLWLLLQRTKVGLALRAVASNSESAKLVGINPGVMLMLGWALAAAIGAVAGTMAASTGNGAFDTSLMQEVLVYSFAAAALGGFDSMLGAVVGGLIVGIANSLTVEYIDALEDIKLVVPFALILLVLVIRPNGLFGRRTVERV